MNPFDQFDAQTPAPTTTLGGAEMMQGSAQGAAQPQQQVNPFDQFGGGATAQSQTVAQPETSGNWFVDGVEAMNRQFSKMALGAMDLAAAPFATAGSTTAQNLQKTIANVNAQEQASVDQAAQRSPWATGTGTVLGAIGSSLAYGGAAATSVPALLGTAAAQGFTNYAPTMGERATDAGIAAGTAGLLLGAGALAKQVKGALFSQKGGPSGLLEKALRPEQAAIRDVGYLAAKTGTNVDEALTAAKNLGVNLTPAQALGGKALGSLEASVEPSIANKGAVLDFTNPQSKAIKDLTKATLEDFTPMGLEKTEGRVHLIQKALGDMNINERDTKFLESLPIVKAGLEKLNNPEIGGTIANVSNSNMAKLQAVKRGIDDQLFNDTMQMVDPSKKLSSVQKDALHEAKDYLQKTLNNYGDYAERDKLAQALAIRGRYTRLLDKKLASEGGELSNDAVHQVLWSSPGKVDYFLKDVATTGGDVAKVKDLIKLSQQTYKSAIDKVLNKQANSNMVKSGVIRDFVDSIAKGRYEAALLNLTLGGNQWADKIAKVVGEASQANREKGFMGLIGDVIKKGMTTGATLGTGRLVSDSTAPMQATDNSGYLTQ